VQKSKKIKTIKIPSKFYFEPTVAGEIRIFGYYNNKQKNKKENRNKKPKTK